MTDIKILAINKDNDFSFLEQNNNDYFFFNQSSKNEIVSTLQNNHIDLVIYDTDLLLDSSVDEFNTIFNLIKNQDIFVVLLVDAKDIDIHNKNFKDLDVVDYITKPFSSLIIQNKISLYLRNIIQKKTTDHLFNEYDKNVIASKTDKKGIITYASNAFCEICGYSKEELIGQPHNIIRHPDMPKELFKDLWKTIKSKKQWTGDIKNKHKDGSFYWVEVVISPELNYNGEIIGYSAIRHDISSKKYIEEILIIDHLTQLYNRKYYDEALQKELYRAQRYNHSLSLLILDIDHFKSINDTYGHDCGDIVLKEFAKIISSNIRISDIASRIGGEEFSIIVPNDNEKETFAFAQKLRRIIEESTFTDVNKITVSIGISSFQKDDTVKTLFKKADKALYNSKFNGRNKVKMS